MNQNILVGERMNANNNASNVAKTRKRPDKNNTLQYFISGFYNCLAIERQEKPS